PCWPPTFRPRYDWALTLQGLSLVASSSGRAGAAQTDLATVCCKVISDGLTLAGRSTTGRMHAPWAPNRAVRLRRSVGGETAPRCGKTADAAREIRLVSPGPQE